MSDLAVDVVAVAPTAGPAKASEEPSAIPARTSWAEQDGIGSFAVVHDWCPSFRGGERVLSELCKVTASTDVYTLFDFLPRDIKDEFFPGVSFHTSIADRLPRVRDYYRSLFFLCPFLVEQFDVTRYDAIISSSAAFARGVLTRPDQPHVCYVHSPVRYAWDEQFSYLSEGKLGYGPKGLLFRLMLHRLRIWDTRTTHGPDVMLANSRYVRDRIRRIYGRDAEVVHPPVPVDASGGEYVPNKADYYVTASFLAPYKRTDLVIRAFNEMPSRRLLVVGDGQQARALRSLATGDNIVFAGYLPRRDYVAAVGNARALIFAGCEDFGIAMAEAQAYGTPVIAFGRGGARDIIRPLGGATDPTGLLFPHQTVEAVKGAVEHFENREREISPAACWLNAARFSPERFRVQIERAIDRAIEMRRDSLM